MLSAPLDRRATTMPTHRPTASLYGATGHVAGVN